jgi:signal transduction histidine kinase
VLALDNERLKADLNARLQDLRASRRRIVEATVKTRRRLERDLHDGAQQRLVSMSVDLQLLRGRLADEPALELLESAIATLGEAQTELRELARGIHPPMPASACQHVPGSPSAGSVRCSRRSSRDPSCR